MAAASSDNSLQLVIRAIDEASGVLNSVRNEISGFSSQTSSDLKRIESASQSSANGVQAFAQSWVGAQGLGAVIGGVRATLTEANKLQSSMIGLGVAANNFGDDANAATTTAKNLASNGLMPVSDEATALRNLLATGYGLPEATQIMQRATDVASFYRQGSLSVGQAVVGMTEGIKNGNEVLADNAGMTTNLTQLVVRQGGALTDLQNIHNSSITRQRLFNGIMDDTSTSVGNAQRYLQTFAGQEQQAGVQAQQIQQKIGGVVQIVAGPLLGALTGAAAGHQDLIVAMAIAGAGAVGFAALMIGLMGTVALTAAVLGGPLTIAIIAVSALIGGLLYGTVREFMAKNGDMVNNFIQGTGQMKNRGGSDMEETSKKARQLAEQLADISENAQKASRDFAQSLSNILKNTQDKIGDIKKQVEDENKAFNSSQQDKTQSYNDALAEQLRSHEQTTADIQKQIEEETLKGRFANLSRLSDLQDRLAKETADYEASTAKKKAEYDRDTANAAADHQSKLSDLQVKLQTETDFLTKHNADLAGIRAADALDEIDKLKQSHNDQMAQLEKQKTRAIENANQTTAGVAGSWNNLPNQINANGLTSSFGNLGGRMGTQMAHALADAFISTWSNMVNSISAAVGNWVLNKTGLNFLADAIHATLHTLHVPGYAAGTSYAPGGWSVVGENGPELRYVPRGAQIYPADQTRQMLNGGRQGVTFNNVFNVFNNADLQHAMDMQAWDLTNA